MRIRKNAKVSPVLMTCSSSTSSSHALALEGVLQTHVCQLNQSPWDVIPFSQYSLALIGEDFNSRFMANNNGHCSGDAIGAVESVASMMDLRENNKPAMNKVEKTDVAIIVNEKCDKINNNISNNDTKRVVNDSGLARGNNLVMGLCQKNDGKGWQCRREAKKGYNFCERHLSLSRSYNNNTSATTNNNTTGVITTASKQKPVAPTLRRTRGGAGAKRSNSSSSNPYEFYYYSGFGPLWGRKRGKRGDPGGGGGGDVAKAEIKAAVENSNSAERSTPPSSSTTTPQINNNRGFDYVEDEDEEDGVVSANSGNKRMRKPVKARSLKSLM